MAGDWIKVEKASAEKPEILRSAEQFGISPDAALGLYVRFWFWLDSNLSEECPDFVRNVSRKSLDKLMSCDGFSAMLESVGWGSFDDSKWILSISNADRHNGSPAKTRALDSKRKKEGRRKMSGFCPEKSGSEKRREDISTNVDIPKKKIRLQEPTPEHQVLAAELGVSCKAEFQKYRDWLASSGKVHKDEEAGFRNWLRKAAESPTRAREPARHGSHVPAVLPAAVPHTEMPPAIAEQLRSLVTKMKAA